MARRLRVVFMGTGAFAVPSLRALVEAGHDVAALVTQPDKEQGRGRAVAPTPSKVYALEKGIPVLQPRRVRLPEAQDALRALAPELQVVVAYGQILPKTVIEIAPLGTVNVHASLLPKYRGAAPIQWAIARGETETGVTTMLIDEGLDTGPTLLAERTPIGATENAAELTPRLAALGAEVLLRTVDGLADVTLTPAPQDHATATLAPLLRKEDGRVDWSLTADEISWRMRGFFPWPGCVTRFADRDLKLIAAEPLGAATDATGTPGRIVSAGREGIIVECGASTRLRLVTVQPESRAPMPAHAFAAGARLAAGQAFS